MAYFQWLNAIWADAALPPLVVNMDESSLVRHPTGLKGTVLKLKQRTRVAADHATLADRRCNISFLASICHEEAVQD